jgi:hypothetical protein
LREECRLKVFENRVLRRIFGPKTVEVTGEWRKLHKLSEDNFGLQLVKKFPEGSLPHSQVPATCPYPEPDQSSPYPHIPLPEDPS